jgi:hypothetical protein
VDGKHGTLSRAALLAPAVAFGAAIGIVAAALGAGTAAAEGVGCIGFVVGLLALTMLWRHATSGIEVARVTTPLQRLPPLLAVVAGLTLHYQVGLSIVLSAGLAVLVGGACYELAVRVGLRLQAQWAVDLAGRYQRRAEAILAYMHRMDEEVGRST